MVCTVPRLAPASPGGHCRSLLGAEQAARHHLQPAQVVNVAVEQRDPSHRCGGHPGGERGDGFPLPARQLLVVTEVIDEGCQPALMGKVR
jgi:hypothetical protein